MATERIAEILSQSQWRTKFDQGYLRWCNSVREAALQMARSGRKPGGAPLERL